MQVGLLEYVCIEALHMCKYMHVGMDEYVQKCVAIGSVYVYIWMCV